VVPQYAVQSEFQVYSTDETVNDGKSSAKRGGRDDKVILTGVNQGPPSQSLGKHTETGVKAAALIQRNWRIKAKIRKRAVNHLLAVIRGKQGRNRALRMRELQFYKSKALQLPRILLVTLVYTAISFLTLFSIFINLIFGIKFDVEKQHKWVVVTYLAIFLDWVVYSSSKIVLEWLLPPYVTECVFVICCASVLLFGYFCGDITEGETSSLSIICDVLPF
jgi:hypothetical protein